MAEGEPKRIDPTLRNTVVGENNVPRQIMDAWIRVLNGEEGALTQLQQVAAASRVIPDLQGLAEAEHGEKQKPEDTVVPPTQEVREYYRDAVRYMGQPRK